MARRRSTPRERSRANETNGAKEAKRRALPRALLEVLCADHDEATRKRAARRHALALDERNGKRQTKNDPTRARVVMSVSAIARAFAKERLEGLRNEEERERARAIGSWIERTFDLCAHASLLYKEEWVDEKGKRRRASEDFGVVHLIRMLGTLPEILAEAKAEAKAEDIEDIEREAWELAKFVERNLTAFGGVRPEAFGRRRKKRRIVE